MASAPSPARSLASQVFRFLLVGGTAALIDYGVLMAGIHFGGSRYFSRILSIAVAVVYTWWLNRHLTFATAAPPSWREFAQYGVLALAGSLLSFALYSGSLWLGAPIWLAFGIGTGVASVFNFLRYRALLANPASLPD